MKFKVHSLDDLTNPINTSLEAFQDVTPNDILVLKLPLGEIPLSIAHKIFTVIKSYFPSNHVICLSTDYDLIDMKSREEYKEFLKRELAQLEEEHGRH